MVGAHRTGIRLEGIYVSEAAGEPMERREAVEAVHGGVAGDRYCTGRGDDSPFDVCEVTLVAAEVLAIIARRPASTSPTAATAGASSSVAATSTTC